VLQVAKLRASADGDRTSQIRDLAPTFLSLLAAAKLGDEEAQMSVGDCAYGITGKVNVDEALRGWMRAYKQGSWAAAFNLGIFFRDAKQWANALK
jgi:TPR repeat protein